MRIRHRAGDGDRREVRQRGQAGGLERDGRRQRVERDDDRRRQERPRRPRRSPRRRAGCRPRTRGTPATVKLVPESVAARPATLTPARPGTSATPRDGRPSRFAVSVPDAGLVILTFGEPRVERDGDRRRPARAAGDGPAPRRRASRSPAGSGRVAVKRLPVIVATTPFTVMSTRFASTNVPVTEIGDDAEDRARRRAVDRDGPAAIVSTTKAETAVELRAGVRRDDRDRRESVGTEVDAVRRNAPPETDGRHAVHRDRRGATRTSRRRSPCATRRPSRSRAAGSRRSARRCRGTAGGSTSGRPRSSTSARTSLVAVASTVTSKDAVGRDGRGRRRSPSRDDTAVSGSRAVPRTRTAASETAASSTGSTRSRTRRRVVHGADRDRRLAHDDRVREDGADEPAARRERHRRARRVDERAERRERVEADARSGRDEAQAEAAARGIQVAVARERDVTRDEDVRLAREVRRARGPRARWTRRRTCPREA